MDCITCMPGKTWELSFLAEPEEVGSLRRALRTHLRLWGLHESIDAAQLCVSELAANVINHVGPGTPATLAVSTNGTHLRIEVHDPDTRALPTLRQAEADSGSGRGLALVTAVAERWGVHVLPERKVTWCELATGFPCVEPGPPPVSRLSRVRTKMAEEAVIGAIADSLYWLRAHGCDADEVLDRAQMHFEGQIAEGVTRRQWPSRSTRRPGARA
ncbi:ATP-binding protein [Streptomyces sp. NPDC050523]|uniref:ATP-binding protein n=1 Tax=Streptomyces sp. NPDC050523 TaxID=3365622 RepID=UPI0037921370